MISGANPHAGAYVAASSGNLSRGEVMPHRRTIKKGSFAGHFDELVTHFPDAQVQPKKRARKDRKLKEKLDIHALLFEHAWRMEQNGRGAD
jgi:hypothetical protein